MRFVADLPWIYWLRLRTRPVQEGLALLGIATGVALLFAVQVANSSVTGSVRQLSTGITGAADMMLVARDAHGIDERTVARVQALDGVDAAAPVMMQRATAVTRSGSTPVQLVGVDDDFAEIGGELVRGFGGAFGLRLANALLAPETLADRLGVTTGDRVTLDVLGRSYDVPVSTVVSAAQIGVLAESSLLVGPLPYVQQLTGLEGRLTHVLVNAAPGRAADVRTALTELAGDRMDVVPSDHEAELIEQAAGPNEQSTGMFAAISMLVGVLFTFNAMLLTIPERRRFIAELRMQGFGRLQLTTLLLFEALVLGIVASMVGLLLGDLLSRYVFHAVPGYLTFAFPVGEGRIVSFRDVAIAFAGGLVATFVAAGRLLVDVYSRRPLDTAYRTSDEPGEGVPPRARRWLLAAAAALVAFAVAVYAFAPAITTIGIGALGIAMVLTLPTILDLAMRGADRVADIKRGGLLSIAVSELRASSTRAVALAATGALAVFGSVAIEGAHQDLLRGLDDNQASFVGTADLWITTGGDENLLTTNPFRPPESLDALRSSPTISAMRPYRGGFVDLLGRRVWMIARDRAERHPIPGRQLVEGDLDPATDALRGGGGAVVSEGLADHLGLGVGDELPLPTPTGTAPLRIAATITNLGWAPGTILLAGQDYRRLWDSDDVTGIEVDLAPGVELAEGRRLVESALGPGSALTVQTSGQRLARMQAYSRLGLERLSQISTLMLIAAALAMAAAMTGAVWQQRRRLAVLRMQGFDVEQVWGVLLMQSAIVLGVGAASGAVAGLAGQVLATRWVTLTTGFPSIFSPAVGLAALTFAGVALVALLVVSIPGYFAARVSPTVSFQSD
jgi:putative ABC transport system permease protein